MCVCPKHPVYDFSLSIGLMGPWTWIMRKIAKLADKYFPSYLRSLSVGAIMFFVLMCEEPAPRVCLVFWGVSLFYWNFFSIWILART